MRPLTRCLQTRPSTLLASASSRSHQPQFTPLFHLNARLQTPRFSSSDNSSSSNHQPPTPTPTATQNPGETRTDDVDSILGKLNLNNTSQQSQSQSQPQNNPPDGLSLSRAVGLSAETEPARPSPRRVEMKLGPSLGRQVYVHPERNMDLTRALGMLNMTLAQNQVKAQSREQKFHVRRGQMKKNLRMSRWRKLFKYSFKHTVGKIGRMRAQGW